MVAAEAVAHRLLPRATHHSTDGAEAEDFKSSRQSDASGEYANSGEATSGLIGDVQDVAPPLSAPASMHARFRAVAVLGAGGGLADDGDRDADRLGHGSPLLVGRNRGQAVTPCESQAEAVTE